MSISSGIKKDQKEVWIKINDNGCGISEQDMEHIFDPFFTTRLGQGGSGPLRHRSRVTTPQPLRR